MGMPLADQCAGPDLWRKDPAGRCALASLDCLPAAEPSPAVQPVRPLLDSTVPQTFLPFRLSFTDHIHSGQGGATV